MNAEVSDSRVSTERRPIHSLHRSLATIALMVLAAHLVVACGGSDAETETGGGDRAQAYVFLSPPEVWVAPGQSLQVQVDIANLPTNDAAFGYAISLSRETTRIDIATETNSPCASGTVSCRIWTITPRTDAPPGDYAFSVRASGTRTSVSEADAKIRVVPIAIGKRAVISASAQHVVTADGRLWGRGPNAAGQTGAGFESVGFDINAPFVLPDAIDPLVPVGTDTDWTAVVSAGETAIALKQDGTVWGWGANPKFEVFAHDYEPTAAYFQLSVSSPRDIQLRPRQILGLAEVIAISAFDVVEIDSRRASPARYLALSRNGTVYGFGGGVEPRENMHVGGTSLYLSTGAPLVVPRLVVPNGTETPLTGIKAIVGGLQNTGRGWALALQDDGTVWQMGSRRGGFISDLGANGIQAGPAMPRRVADLPASAVTAITVGEINSTSYEVRMLYSLVATEAGEVWSWTELDTVPHRVNGIGGVVALDSNNFGSVTALDSQGGVWRWEFGRTAPHRVAGMPAMGRLAHRGPNWAISADCAAGRGRAVGRVRWPAYRPLWQAASNDGCTSQGTITLTIGKIGSGTVSTDPVDEPLDLVCGVNCVGPISVPVRLREAVRVRGTPAPGWRGPYFDPECSNGEPLLDASTSCVVRFEPRTLEGRLNSRSLGPRTRDQHARRNRLWQRLQRTLCARCRDPSDRNTRSGLCVPALERTVTHQRARLSRRHGDDERDPGRRRSVNR